MPDFSEAMQAWARKRATRLADEFLASADRGGAAAFLDAACGREKLLSGALRPCAEAAFRERVAERHGGQRHG